MGGLDKINIKLPQQFATSLVEQKDHDTTPRKKTTSTTLTNQQVSLSPSSNTTGSNAYTEDTSYHQLSNNQEDFQNFNSNFAIIYEQESKDETDIKVSKKKMTMAGGNDCALRIKPTRKEIQKTAIYLFQKI